MSKYDDIINLPHYVSRTRPPMSMENRAAQFAPFAALSGHYEAINETARQTSSKIELSEGDLANLTKRLDFAIQLQSPVTITYFQPDSHKKGGQYVTAHGIIKKIDEYDGCIIFTDKRSIRLADVLSIDGNIFNDFDN